MEKLRPKEVKGLTRSHDCWAGLGWGLNPGLCGNVFMFIRFQVVAKVFVKVIFKIERVCTHMNAHTPIHTHPLQTRRHIHTHTYSHTDSNITAEFIAELGLVS